jgi:hypothetical protein
MAPSADIEARFRLTIGDITRLKVDAVSTPQIFRRRG